MKNEKPLKSNPDLHQMAVKGSYWVLLGRFLSQVLGSVKSITVAHFLLLNDLGLIAAAVLFMEVLNTFSESGFHNALIQKKGDITTYLDTAWVVSILRGVLLFTVVFFAAPVVVSLKVPEDIFQSGNYIQFATTVIRVMGLCLLIRSFQNIGVVNFMKHLNFHKSFLMTITCTVVDFTVSVSIIMIYRSVWGYIAGRVLSACVGLILSYVLSSYRPRFHFSVSKAKELWKFGKWIFGVGPVVYLLNQADDFFVWFYLGFSPLALYRYAYHFSDMPATQISNVISQITFPAYSKIQDDIPRLRNAYLKVLQSIAILSVPASFLIYIFGPDLVRLFLPERMLPMILTLQLLSLKGLLKSLGSPQGPIYRAIGKPQITLHILWVKLVILAVTVYPLTKRWGIAGTAASTILINLVVDPVSIWITSRILQCSVFRMLKTILCPLLSACLMAAVIIPLKTYVFSQASLPVSLGLLIVAGSLYFGFLWFLDTVLKSGIQNIIREQMKPVRMKLKRGEIE